MSFESDQILEEPAAADCSCDGLKDIARTIAASGRVILRKVIPVATAAVSAA
jgi:hypothetical protein